MIANQILRSGTSVGANYAEACRTRSDADFISKHELCLQELEETLYWLDLLMDSEITSQVEVSPIRAETEELISIFVSIVIRTKKRLRSS